MEVNETKKDKAYEEVIEKKRNHQTQNNDSLHNLNREENQKEMNEDKVCNTDKKGSSPTNADYEIDVSEVETPSSIVSNGYEVNYIGVSDDDDDNEKVNDYEINYADFCGGSDIQKQYVDH